jgi:hypothetical protein
VNLNQQIRSKTKNQQTLHKTTNKHDAAQDNKQTQHHTKTAKTYKKNKEANLRGYPLI